MANELKFQRLRLKNWKNFQDVDVEVRDRMFLVGANAAGKSNLLDAFRFLRDLASVGGGFGEAVERRGGMGAIRCLAARRNTDVEIAVDIQQGGDGPLWSYELSFWQDGRRRPARPLLRRERVSRDGETLLERPNEDDIGDPARLSQTHIEQVNTNRRFREVVDFFRSIHYLHIVPQLVRDPRRSTNRIDDPYGGDFLDRVERTPESRREPRLKRIENALRLTVPRFTNLELTHDKGDAPRLRAKLQHWRPQGAWQTEEQFSDGTLRLIGLLWAATEKRGPLLLEEPEISLHPGIVRVLPQMLACVRRPSANQVFLSTHSPELLCDEGIGLDETLLFLPGHEGTAIAPAASFDDARALLEGGLNLGDIVIPKTQPPDAIRLSWLADA